MLKRRWKKTLQFSWVYTFGRNEVSSSQANEFPKFTAEMPPFCNLDRKMLQHQLMNG